MRRFAFIILTFAVLLLPSVVFAKNENESEVAHTPKGESVKSEIREKNIERKEEFKERLTEKRKENIEKYWENMIHRFESAVEHLERLIERMQSKLDKMEALGQDVSSLEAKLNEAKGKLVQTEEDLEDLNGDLNELLESDEPKEVFEHVREDVKNIKGLLVDTHKSLVKIKEGMKGVRNEQKENNTH